MEYFSSIVFREHMAVSIQICLKFNPLELSCIKLAMI